MLTPGRPDLDEARIRDLLAGTGLAARVRVLPSVGSTNDEIRRLAAAGAPALTTVLAEEQTAGRGRLARRWHSPRGRGLYVSVLFRPARPVRETTRWTLAAVVAACRACRAQGPTRPAIEIEWPNDLVHDGRKLAGILSELRSVGPRPSDLIVGTGINVGQGEDDFPEELRGRATSLRIATGRDDLDRSRLAAEYLAALVELAEALDAGRWAPLAAEWSRLAPGSEGRRVLLRPAEPAGAGDTVAGVTRGLDSTGALIVETEDGHRRCVRAGDAVSVRARDALRPADDAVLGRS